MAGLTERPLRHVTPLSRDSIGSLRLRRQWAILSTADSIHESWHHIRLRSGQVLVHHPDALVTRLDGEIWGVIVIGAAVTTDTQSSFREQLRQFLVDDERVTVDALHRLAGTYVVIRHHRTGQRVYTDPAGMMPVFYRGEKVASTPTLLAPLERDVELDNRFPFGPDNDWYPWSITPFLGVMALPANHVLTLPDCQIERFWPTGPPPRLSDLEGVELAAQLLRRITIAATELGPLLCSLTGGKDSRVNLAALGEQSAGVEFFTIRGRDISTCDIRIPEALSLRFGLDHRFVDDKSAPPWLLDLYDEMMSGMSIGGRRSVIGAAALLGSKRYVHLNGNLGALAKSFFWHARNPHTVRESALAKEFTNRPPQIKAGIRQWVSSLPELDAPTTYNLMYLEQRGGRWMGVGEGASNLFYTSFTPFCSREVFETLCGLSTSRLYGGDVLVGLVEELWPELLTVNYCRARRNWSAHVPRSLKNRLKRILGPGKVP